MKQFIISITQLTNIMCRLKGSLTNDMKREVQWYILTSDDRKEVDSHLQRGSSCAQHFQGIKKTPHFVDLSFSKYVQIIQPKKGQKYMLTLTDFIYVGHSKLLWPKKLTVKR